MAWKRELRNRGSIEHRLILRILPSSHADPIFVLVRQTHPRLAASVDRVEGSTRCSSQRASSSRAARSSQGRLRPRPRGVSAAPGGMRHGMNSTRTMSQVPSLMNSRNTGSGTSSASRRLCAQFLRSPARAVAHHRCLRDSKAPGSPRERLRARARVGSGLYRVLRRAVEGRQQCRRRLCREVTVVVIHGAAGMKEHQHDPPPPS